MAVKRVLVLIQVVVASLQRRQAQQIDLVRRKSVCWQSKRTTLFLFFLFCFKFKRIFFVVKVKMHV